MERNRKQEFKIVHFGIRGFLLKTISLGKLIEPMSSSHRHTWIYGTRKLGDHVGPDLGIPEFWDSNNNFCCNSYCVYNYPYGAFDL